MPTTISKLYKRLREPMNASQPNVERYWVLGSFLEYVMKTTAKLLCIFTPGNIKFYKADGVTVLFEVDETTGATVNGASISTLIKGKANFSGQGGAVGTTVTIADQGTIDDYEVKITPYGGSTIVGTIGVPTVEKISGSQFKVFNEGSATSEFYYEVTI